MAVAGDNGEHKLCQFHVSLPKLVVVHWGDVTLS